MTATFVNDCVNSLSAIYNLNCETHKVLDIENSFQTFQLLLSEEISLALEKTRGSKTWRVSQ